MTTVRLSETDRGTARFVQDSGKGGVAESLHIAWLGQAGFAFGYADRFLMIDPYLSDFLAAKYRGREFPHVRLMPPPVEPHEVRALDMVLATHRHSDHMDPEGLPALMANNPSARLVLPRALMAHAAGLGIDVSRSIGLDAGESLDASRDIRIRAVASAHETLDRIETGEHLFLGYILQFGNISVYHSGDCVPYEGLAETLSQFQIDVALLPVNGRSEFLGSRNIPGNFFFSEAVALCRSAGIPELVCHHFGMFAFNTVEKDWLQEQIAGASHEVRCHLPSVDKTFDVREYSQ